MEFGPNDTVPSYACERNTPERARRSVSTMQSEQRHKTRRAHTYTAALRQSRTSCDNSASMWDESTIMSYMDRRGSLDYGQTNACSSHSCQLSIGDDVSRAPVRADWVLGLQVYTAAPVTYLYVTTPVVNSAKEDMFSSSFACLSVC